MDITTNPHDEDIPSPASIPSLKIDPVATDNAVDSGVTRRGQAPQHWRRILTAAMMVTALVGGGVGFGVSQMISSPMAPPFLTHASTTFPSSVNPGSGFGGLGNGSVNPGGSLGSGGGSQAPTSNGTSGPSNAASIAQGVDPGLVDINTNLSYQSAQAAGTGMVLTSGGEVLTNNHVIQGATSINVTDIGNGKTYQADVVGYDPTQDVAVLQLIGASGLSTAKLGDSSSVNNGAAVVGIGNGGGVGGTPSYAGGTITGLNQSITASDSGSGNSENLTGMLATNAGIEPGDSGGPLVNASGQVIGMDTAGSSSNGGFGVNFGGVATASQAFAIPINTAIGIAKEIEMGTTASIIHLGATAFLGVQVQSANASSGTGLGNGSGGTSTPGVVITGVVNGEPAANAGLVAGDTITSVNGTPVTNPTSLGQIMLSLRPSTNVPITYLTTGGTPETASVTLAAGPPQ